MFKNFQFCAKLEKHLTQKIICELVDIKIFNIVSSIINNFRFNSSSVCRIHDIFKCTGGTPFAAFLFGNDPTTFSITEWQLPRQ